MKITLFDNPQSFNAPSSRNPREYPCVPYIFRNLNHWPTFCCWLGLSLFRKSLSLFRFFCCVL